MRRKVALGLMVALTVVVFSTAARGGDGVLAVVPEKSVAVLVVNNPGDLARQVGGLMFKMKKLPDANALLAAMRLSVTLAPGPNTGFDEAGAIAIVLTKLPAMGAPGPGGKPANLMAGEGMLRIIPVTSFQKYMTSLGGKLVDGVYEVPAVMAVATDPNTKHYCVKIGKYAVVSTDKQELLKLAAAPKLAASTGVKQKATFKTASIILHARGEKLGPVLQGMMQKFMMGMMVGRMIPGDDDDAPAVPPAPAPAPSGVEPFGLRDDEVPVELMQFGPPAVGGPGPPDIAKALAGIEWLTLGLKLDRVALKLDVLIQMTPGAQDKEMLQWFIKQKCSQVDLLTGLPAGNSAMAGGMTFTDIGGFYKAIEKLMGKMPFGAGMGMGGPKGQAAHAKLMAKARKQFAVLMDDSIKAMEGVTGVSFLLTGVAPTGMAGVEIIHCRNTAVSLPRMRKLMNKTAAMLKEQEAAAGTMTIQQAAFVVDGVTFDKIEFAMKVVPDMPGGQEVKMVVYMGAVDATHLVVGIGEDLAPLKTTIANIKNGAAGLANEASLAKVRGLLDKDRFAEVLIVPSAMIQSIMKGMMGGGMMGGGAPGGKPPMGRTGAMSNQPPPPMGPPAGGPGMGMMGPLVMLAGVTDPIAFAATGSGRTVKLELVVPRQLIDMGVTMAGAMGQMAGPGGRP